jgi:hypothetical protein
MALGGDGNLEPPKGGMNGRGQEIKRSKADACDEMFGSRSSLKIKLKLKTYSRPRESR